MKATFRREPLQLENGATLWQWKLETAEGDVIDGSLPTAPTRHEGHVYFVTSESVEVLDGVELVAHVTEVEAGRRMTLYRVAADRCTMTRAVPSANARPRSSSAEREPTP